MSKFSKLLLAGLLMVTMVGYADNIDEFELSEVVVPRPADEVGLTATIPHLVLDDSPLHGGNTFFAFQPGLDIVPGTGDFFAASMGHQGGWQGDAICALYKIDKNGNILAGPVSVSDNNEPWGFSTGWSVGAFSDGGCVAAGGANFGLGMVDGVDLFIEGAQTAAYRVYDSNLNPTTPLMSTFEPANQVGVDERGSPVGDVSDVAVLSNDRFVVVRGLVSSSLQTAAGITDTGEAPGSKIAYRVFERDGTPVGPTRIAFDAAWGASHGNDPDITDGPNGTFAISVAAAGILANEDNYPVQMFDNDGNRIGEPFSVTDPQLLDIGGVATAGIVGAEISYGGGVFALARDITLEVLASNTMGVTLFDAEGNVIRTTFDGLRHKDLIPQVREGDIASDTSGNVIVCNRSDQDIPESGDPAKVQFAQMWTSDGEPFLSSFLSFPNEVNGGSQRDPFVTANEQIIVIASSNEGAPGSFNAHGGVNALSAYENPMPQTPVVDWMIH